MFNETPKTRWKTILSKTHDIRFLWSKYYSLRLIFSELHSRCVQHICISSCTVSVVRYCCAILTSTRMFQQILVKLPNIKFNENLFSDSLLVTCGKTDGQGSMVKWWTHCCNLSFRTHQNKVQHIELQIDRNETKIILQLYNFCC
jgi:hypothetical protein